jgi:hypothetical protein
MEFTANRLRCLRPGQRMCFYRGTDFEHLSHHPDCYYQMMMRLKDTVNELVLSGRIQVVRTKGGEPPFEATYFATGL